MTQEEKYRLQYMISVMQAYKEGKEIEVKWIDGKWRGDVDITWDWRCYDYRVKPEPPKPQYCPFESAEEVMDAIKEHGAYLTINLEYGNRIQIVEFNNYNIWCGAGAEVKPLRYYFEEHFMFCDGTPFGKLVTE